MVTCRAGIAPGCGDAYSAAGHSIFSARSRFRMGWNGQAPGVLCLVLRMTLGWWIGAPVKMVGAESFFDKP